MTGWWENLTHFFRIGTVQWRMVASYMWVYFRRKLRIPHSPDALSRIHASHARRFKAAATALKGANVKIGQLVSLQAHVLPTEYVEAFKSLRDEVSPTPYSEIAQVIESELGKPPHELFDDFSERPIAAASMAQVHQARLPSGESVVVKVLYPGLERSVAIDLWLTRRLLWVLKWIFRRIDLKQIYREAEGPLLEELDLTHEGRSTDALRGPLADVNVQVPQVYWDYTRKKVLTLEYIEGCHIDNRAQMDAWNVDRKALMQAYLRAFFRQAFEDGYFHCDPHPGNTLCTEEGSLALLDFGMVKSIPDTVRVGLVKEILGGFFNNPKLYADGIIERGIVEERERHVLEQFATNTFTNDDMRSVIFDHQANNSGDITLVLGKVKDLVVQLETFSTPQNQLMFLRALGIVIDVVREVYPEEPLSVICLPVVMPLFMQFLEEHPQYKPWAAQAFQSLVQSPQTTSAEPHTEH